MAETQSAPRAKPRAPEPDETEQVVEEPQGWPLQTMVERARVHFHCSPHAVAGALSGEPADKLWTVAEAKERVHEFLASETGEDDA